MKIIHYTTLEIGFTHIIQTMKLRFGPISSTNDPHEYKERAVGFNTDIDSYIENEDLLKDALSDIEKAKERIKIGCFVGEPDLDWKKGEGIIKPRMWAQYGGNHTGMAFVLDKNLFVEKCKERAVDSWAAHGDDVKYVPASSISCNSPSMVSFNGTEKINEALIAKKIFDNAKKPLV